MLEMNANANRMRVYTSRKIRINFQLAVISSLTVQDFIRKMEIQGFVIEIQ